MTALTDAEAGAGAPPSRIGCAERLVYLAAFTILICARLPDVVLEGRFWAEEGTVFFHRAWTVPWYDAIFAAHGGYLNVVANVGGIFARHSVPLESAPYVTTTLGLLCQLAPAVVLLTARDAWLQHRAVLILALVLIAIPPNSEEVWLQTLHGQFHLTLAAVLVLALKTETGAVEWLRRGFLLLGSLSGLGVAVLLPLFVLRAIIDRSGARAMQALFLGAGVALQFFLFFSVIPRRDSEIDISLLFTAITSRYLVVPFLGTSIAEPVVTDLFRQVRRGHPALWPQVVAPIAFIAVTTAVYLRGRADLIWLFVAGCSLALVTFYGALADLNVLIHLRASRYVYTQQAIFGLVVLGLAATGRDTLSKLAWVLVVWLTVAGAASYFVTDDASARGPEWNAEVAAWRNDPSRKLSIWPEGWHMRLPP